MKKESNGSVKNDLPIREELGAVLYVSFYSLIFSLHRQFNYMTYPPPQDPNILGFKGPRKMTILMHTLTRDGKRPEFRPTSVRHCSKREMIYFQQRRKKFVPETRDLSQESETLLSKYKDGGSSDLLVLHNKSPQWNEGMSDSRIPSQYQSRLKHPFAPETQSFVLNFNGRVSQASVKNFQIVHDNDCKYHHHRRNLS